jgi:hypothetical protein
VAAAFFLIVVKDAAADATDAPQPWGFLCNPLMKMTMMMIIIIFCPFPSNGAPVEWNWQGEKPKNSGKNLSQCHFVHQKSHVDWPGIEPGPPRW